MLERDVLRNNRRTEQAVTGVQRGADGPDQRINNNNRHDQQQKITQRQADKLTSFNTAVFTHYPAPAYAISSCLNGLLYYWIY